MIGIGRRQVSLRIARRVVPITHTTIDIAKGVAQAELVIVCTPVAHIAGTYKRPPSIAPRERSLPTPAAPSSRSSPPWTTICPAAAASSAAIPSPAEKTGKLCQGRTFDGRVAVLTPTKNTRPEDYDLLDAFWQSLGSIVVRMTPEEHDRALAVTSHLPHMAAAARANTITENDSAGGHGVAGNG